MTSLPDSYDLMQNSALGCCCIGQFVRSYSARNSAGPPLPLLVVVLPITFHERTVEILNHRRFKGGLLNAKAEHKDLGVGMQERISEMYEQSMAAIRLCLALGLGALRADTGTVTPLGRKVPSDKFPLTVRKMLWTADRLGYWMGEGPIEMACSHLKIIF